MLHRFFSGLIALGKAIEKIFRWSLKRTNSASVITLL